MKRWLHLFHRWAGIALCGFFALWFFSGFFMMYVEYPQLTRPERLAAAPALDFPASSLTPSAAAADLRAGDFSIRGTPTKNVALSVSDPAAPVKIDGVRLARILDRPAYVFTSGLAQPIVVWADSGTKAGKFDPEQAGAAARAFRPGSMPRLLGTIQSDQWAVPSALNPHRPLHHFAFDDEAGTELYVSSSTGEVVRDSTRRERVLNYFGAVTHYLYPHVLRQFPDAWAWVVDVVAASGCVLAFSGLWIGVLRARRRVPVPRSAQQRLIRWHYVTGAVFGGVTLTWVFSGWMSMNPGQLNPPRTPTATERFALAGRALTVGDFARPSLPPEAVEADLVHYADQPFYRTTCRDGRTTLVPAMADPAAPVNHPRTASLVAAAPSLKPGAVLVESRELTAYDNYYYTRHPESGAKPLPVVRVRFDDAERTWFHLDPATGQVLERSTRLNRAFRWLYHGLHFFDWWWLWSRRPLWDIVVITFCAGGFSLSVLGLVVGVRRLRAEYFPPAPAATSVARPSPTLAAPAPNV